jgi:hypothetical protein
MTAVSKARLMPLVPLDALYTLLLLTHAIDDKGSNVVSHRPVLRARLALDEALLSLGHLNDHDLGAEIGLDGDGRGVRIHIDLLREAL